MSSQATPPDTDPAPAGRPPAGATRRAGRRGRPWRPAALITVGLAAVLVAVLALGGAVGNSNGRRPPASSPAAVQPPVAANGSAGPVRDPVADDIALQQSSLREHPNDPDAWALLGLDYVDQAKVTVNPAYYPKAVGVLARSLALNSTSNVLGFAGMAALKAAEHDFAAARGWAQRGLAFDAYNTVLYGALDDADTQLGRYSEAFAAAQRLNQLHPGVPAFTRAEYVYELRGDIPHAEAAMRRALDTANSPADTAFAQYYLGELAFNRGDPAASLRFNDAGLAADPGYSLLLQGKARAEAALGQVEGGPRLCPGGA